MVRENRATTKSADARGLLRWGIAFIGLLALSGPVRSKGVEGGDELLARTQAAVDEFVDKFAYLRYEEDVDQQKLKDNQKVDYSRQTVFDSIMRMHFEEGRLRVDEQRLEEKLPAHNDGRPLVSTNGFSTLAMIFHPYYANSFMFTRLPDDTVNGKLLGRIRFEHIPGKLSPILYQVFNADRPLELSGTAWVSPSTAEIYRIEASTFGTLSEMGIKEIRAQIAYGDVTLRDETQPQWLPVSATVDLETPRQHWRNIHRFQDYRKYRVAVNLTGSQKQ